jgi:hypothetical protein
MMPDDQLDRRIERAGRLPLRQEKKRVETFGTQPETGTRIFLFGFAVTR